MVKSTFKKVYTYFDLCTDVKIDKDIQLDEVSISSYSNSFPVLEILRK